MEQKTPQFAWRREDKLNIGSESPKVSENVQYCTLKEFPELISFVRAVPDGIFGHREDRNTYIAMTTFLLALWQQAKFSVFRCNSTFNPERKSIHLKTEVDTETRYFHDLFQSQSNEDNIIGFTFESNEGTDFLLILPNQPLSISAAKFIFKNVKASLGLWTTLQRLGVQGQNCLARVLEIPCLGNNRFLTGVHGSWLSLLEPSVLSLFMKHVVVNSGEVQAGFLNVTEWIPAIVKNISKRVQRIKSHRVNLSDEEFTNQLSASPNHRLQDEDALRMSDRSYYIIDRKQEEFILLVPPAKTSFLLTEKSLKCTIRGGLNIGIEAELQAEGTFLFTKGPEFDESKYLSAQPCVILNLALLNRLEVATKENNKPELDEKFRNLSEAMMRSGFRIEAAESSLYQAFAIHPDVYLREFTKFEGSHCIRIDNLAFREYFIYPREVCEEYSSILDTEEIHRKSINEIGYLIAAMVSPNICRLIIYLGFDTQYFCRGVRYGNRRDLADKEFDISRNLGGWII